MHSSEQATSAQIAELQRRHRALGMQIEQESRHTAPDDTLVRKLKKAKLALKDQLELLRQQQRD